MKKLEGRVAVVTGAASGIGLGLAERFVAEKMSVVLADVEQEPLDEAVAKLKDAGANVIGVRTDVSKADDLQTLADRTIDEFGAVHVLCNNAGVETGASFADIPVESWEWVLNVNLWGVLNGCRIFLPLLRQQEEGHIVNTASVAAFASGIPTFAPYVVSKFAILAASESLEAELRTSGEQIGISVLCPGVVKTKMPQAERNRPAGVPDTSGDPVRTALLGQLVQVTAEIGMEPEAVAGQVVDAIRENRFFILTHPDEAIAPVRDRLAWMETGVRPEMPPVVPESWS